MNPPKRTSSWPLILTVAVVLVMAPILLLGWTLYVTFREPWDDMERALADVSIPAGFSFESEQRYGADLLFLDSPSIHRTYVALDDGEALETGLCNAARINDAAVTLSDERTCRATTSAPPSLLERIVFWNGGYTLTIVTSDDRRDDHPITLTVSVSE
jgi:hypothetical protein